MRKVERLSKGMCAARGQRQARGWPAGHQPPRSRLFGGDAPRGGNPAGVGHAGISLAQEVLAAASVAIVLIACSLAQGTAVMALEGGAASSACAQGKLSCASQVLKGNAYHRTPAIVATMQQQGDAAGSTARADSQKHRRLSTLLAKRSASISTLLARRAERQRSDPDRLSMRIAALSGASLAAISTIVSIRAAEPGAKRRFLRATKRRRRPDRLERRQHDVLPSKPSDADVGL